MKLWKQLVTLAGGGALLLATGAVSAASMELVGTGSSIGQHGVYAGLYELTIDGSTVYAMCDDYTTDVSIGDTWQANPNDYAAVTGANAGKFFPADPTHDTKYSQVGWLFSQVEQNPTTYAQREHNADINFAIWEIMAPGALSSKGWWNGSASKDLYNQAQSHGDFDFSNVMLVYTPDPTWTSQELLVPVPLPAALWLFLSALGGLVMLTRRRAMAAGDILPA